MNHWVSAASKIAELIKDGKLGGAVRDSLITVALVIATGHLSRIDKRFESIEGSIATMSDSVVKLNQAVMLSTETTGWHGKEIQRHSRELEKLWDAARRAQKHQQN